MRGRRARVERSAKSCGPDTAVLVSSSWEARFSGGGGRRWQEGRSPGEHEVSRERRLSGGEVGIVMAQAMAARSRKCVSVLLSGSRRFC